MAALTQAIQDDCHNPAQKATGHEVGAHPRLSIERPDAEQHSSQNQEHEYEDLHARESTRYVPSSFAASSALAACQAVQ